MKHIGPWLLLSAAVALAVGMGANIAAAQTAAPPAATAEASPARPADDVAKDAARKPAEVMAFAGVKPGQTVADFIMGGGYFTRVLAEQVGPTGKVYAYQPAEYIAYQASYGESLKTVDAALDNVEGVTGSLGAVTFPAPVDVIVTAQNYHDLHLKVMPAPMAGMVNKALFEALKPGGTLLVIDHYAADGSGLRDADTLHRIDKATVISELSAVGFKLDGESEVLRQPSDSRTASVFDPAIRGKTDQFVLKFSKPA